MRFCCVEVYTTTAVAQTSVGIWEKMNSISDTSPKADSYGTKNLYENGPNPFFVLFFSILWEREWSRFVQPNLFEERFVTRLQPDLVPRFVCTSDTKLQTDFARGATITTFGQ